LWRFFSTERHEVAPLEQNFSFARVQCKAEALHSDFHRLKPGNLNAINVLKHVGQKLIFCIVDYYLLFNYP